MVCGKIETKIGVVVDIDHSIVVVSCGSSLWFFLGKIIVVVFGKLETKIGVVVDIDHSIVVVHCGSVLW